MELAICRADLALLEYEMGDDEDRVVRLFQNCGLGTSYLTHLNGIARSALTFDERRRVLLDYRFGALHLLILVLDGDRAAFITCGNDYRMQALWARESGLTSKTSLEDILLAQIEHHRTEIFYNLDPIRFPSSFARRLPGCVVKTLCWRAAPSG